MVPAESLDLTCITGIGLDHTGILGGSKELILEAKSGIMKEGVPMLIGNTIDFQYM